jgi:hypothetical protein
LLESAFIILAVCTALSYERTKPSQEETKVMVAIPKKKIVEVKVLYTERCVNTPPTISLIGKTAKEDNVPIQLTKMLISSQQEANEHHLHGSPTVMINGFDLDPAMREDRAYGFA